MTSAIKSELRRIERRKTFGALIYVGPALLVVFTFFVVPILLTFYRSIENGAVSQTLPEVTQQLTRWNGKDFPDDITFAALARDLERGTALRSLGLAGRRLNMEIPGYLTLLQVTGRRLAALEAGSPKDSKVIIGMDARWGESRYWAALRRASSTLTDYYYLTALDLQRADSGEIQPIDPDRRLYIDVMGRSVWIGVCVTIVCLLLAYPASLLLVSVPTGVANLLLMLVLLPFWTSILVRTASWMVLLQKEGIINSTLLALNIVTEPQAMIFNRFGVVVALSHVLLPYMILTLYSVMKRIDGQYVRAARALGANPFQAFWRVYLPQTYPGIAGGGLLVFILAIGSYVTPALVGGRHDQMISYFIAYNVNQNVNWGLAAALSVFLLITVLALFPLYLRFAGSSRGAVG